MAKEENNKDATAFSSCPHPGELLWSTLKDGRVPGAFRDDSIRSEISTSMIASAVQKHLLSAREALLRIELRLYS